MEHIGTKTIKTSRLKLRAFEKSDAKAMYERWASDEEVTHFLTWKPHQNIQVTQNILTDWIDQYQNLNYYNWAIVMENQDDLPIGNISVVETHEKVHLAVIGYCLSRQYWHQGIMSEALHAIIDFLFNEVGYECIQSRHDPRNKHSGQVMLKCGMKYEGTLRHSDWNNQGIVDACYYSILKDEYKKKV